MHERQPSTNPEQPANHEQEPVPRPAIYVASMADYNNGVLHGSWIDAAREPEAIHADIAAMLARSREPAAEEFAIHDYEQFGLWKVGEYDSIELVSRIARGIAEHGLAFAAWADVFDGEPASFDADSFQDAYLGHYDSVTDYVEQMADESGYDDSLAILPDALRQYVRFDYEALARDMEASGEIAAVRNPQGGVWLFRTTD
jgi:antirestriction protein